MSDSVFDRFDPELSKTREMIAHRLQLLGGMSLPIRNLACDAQRIASAIRLRRIAGKLLVRQIRIIFNRAGRFDDVDSAASLACSQFGAPGRGI